MINQIKEKIDNILVNLDMYEKGNKAAGRRVRVQSVELAKLFKDFRKESVKA